MGVLWGERDGSQENRNEKKDKKKGIVRTAILRN